MQNPNHSMELMLRDYRLTTAEILYHLPDHPVLLQSFTWQEYDLAPKFPELHKFLKFWQKEIEGRLHSVKVCAQGLVCPAEFRYNASEMYIH